MEKIRNKDKYEKLLWSIALPGLGQLLNGNTFKGVFFIILEILINVQSNFNEAIMFSFYGNIDQAIAVTDYQWLMFYPCLYMFAMWDAYKDAGGSKSPFSFIPFVVSAYFVTVGLIYSAAFTIDGILYGPIWLPIIFLMIGLSVGIGIKDLLIRMVVKK